MSLTLEVFYKKVKAVKDRPMKAALAGQIFEEYCEANDISFVSESEKAKCKRLFLIGYMMKDAMDEYGK